MATPDRTQKQIAERYKGNLGYYNKKHPWRLARIIVSALAIIGGILGIWIFQKRGREEFFNAGTISSPHASIANDCKQCHDTSAGVPRDRKQFVSTIDERFHKGLDFGAIDRKCEVCHQQHTLHEPNVVENRSCSACHMEHQGNRSLLLVATSQCAACHNNRGVMQASAAKGAQLSPQTFHLRAHPAQQVVLNLRRPERGYTDVFPSFANGHPEFRLDHEKIRDPDVLRFNHQRHLGGSDIPPVNGKKLDCNYCHRADPDGRYYQRISFAANCQACHSLQFDAKNPELLLPHGDATAVRAFLHALPTQYADLAAKKGLVRPGQIQSFVAQQMLQLRERVRSGEDFERQVFFTTDPYKPQRETTARTRSSFYGCAFCHEVKARPNLAPEITRPVFIDRWMPHARFDHMKHTSVKCDECHHASGSRATADVLMPTKANCVTCHSPQGKVVSECITCHRYHDPGEIAAKTPAAPAAGANSFRNMLVGWNAAP